MYQGPKRSLAALLVAALLVMPVTALADSPEPRPAAEKVSPADPSQFKLTKDEAVAAARRFFAIPAELSLTNVGMNQSEEGVFYALEFRTSSKRPDQIMVNVQIDGLTGVVRGYTKWVNDPGAAAAPLTLTRKEAREKALYWVDMLAPALKPSLKEAEDPNQPGYYGGANATYGFRWNRVAEGYPVQYDSLNVVINARTGELVEFSRGGWRNQPFKLPEKILEQAGAEAVYRSQVAMVLYYQQYQQPGVDTPEWRLVYRPGTGFYPLVNHEGKLINHTGEVIDMASFPRPEQVPAPDKAYKAPENPLSREEALALARQVAGRTDEPTSSNSNERTDDQMFRSWQFTWNLENKEGQVNVQIDLDRGVVASFNQWGPYEPLKENEEPALTEAQARAKAVAFVRSYRPDLAASLMLISNEESRNPYYRLKMGNVKPRSYYVPFMHTKNGIPVADRNLSVEVDAMTGEIRSFWAYGMEVKAEFPSAKGVLDAKGAMDAFLKHQGLELSWTRFFVPVMPGQKQEQKDPQLFWMPGQRYPLATLDAMTGHPLDWGGRDLVEAAKRPLDIEGHAAQREIELLWQRGIFELKDGKFNPDQTVTAAELARWLVMARGMQPFSGYNFRGAFGGSMDMVGFQLEKSEAAPYFGAALQGGIVLPEDFAGLDPNGTVSRELFALWTVRAKGYGALARMPNKIEMPFADQSQIDARYANAVAMLHGLGVIKGDSKTSFAPRRSLTRGEAAQMLFSVVSEVRYH